MNKRILLTAFFLGILLGVTLFYHPSEPTAAVTCTYEGESCSCGLHECLCGNDTIPSGYCTQDLNNGK